MNRISDLGFEVKARQLGRLVGGRVLGRFCVFCVLALTVLPELAGAQEGVETLRFSLLNRAYENVVEELEPIVVGGAQVRLRSPRHVLTIVDNVTTLIAGGTPGSWRATVDLSFRGEGEIEADVSLGRIQQTLRDFLVAPEQSLHIEALLSVAKSDEGYLIRTLELPAYVRVHIESRLIGSLISLCRPMALVLIGTDCLELERSLSNLQVPMPKAGESYILPYTELTADERARFDRWLDRG